MKELRGRDAIVDIPATYKKNVSSEVAELFSGIKEGSCQSFVGMLKLVTSCLISAMAEAEADAAPRPTLRQQDYHVARWRSRRCEVMAMR